jgi:hypothetical protein
MRPANDNARSSPLKLRHMPLGSRLFAGLGLLVAAMAVLAGLLTIDPPWTVRKIRLDNDRANGLASLTEAVGRFSRDKGRLPQSLDELQQLQSGYQPHRPINDPVTGTAYDYIPGQGLDYQVCATFDLTNKIPQGRQQSEWPHEAGRSCFTRTAPVK